MGSGPESQARVAPIHTVNTHLSNERFSKAGDGNSDVSTVGTRSVISFISALGCSPGIGSRAIHFLSEPQFLCLSNEAVGRDISMDSSHETCTEDFNDILPFPLAQTLREARGLPGDLEAEAVGSARADLCTSS